MYTYNHMMSFSLNNSFPKEAIGKEVPLPLMVDNLSVPLGVFSKAIMPMVIPIQCARTVYEVGFRESGYSFTN